MIKELSCIICPMSCHIRVELDENNNITSVSGNTCNRGEKYVRQELISPIRMVTSTVRIEHGLYARLPVILSGEIPKDKIFTVMEQINKVKVCAPIKINDIIIEDICGLGVHLLASRSMDRI